MTDYILLMHDAGADIPPEAWTIYIEGLSRSGHLRSGSAIGGGIACRKDGMDADITAHLTGFIRIEADSLEDAKGLLAGNPAYEAGGTNSKIIDHYIDADFGKLDLVETHYMAGLNGGPMKSTVMRSWVGHAPDTKTEISINFDENPPSISDDIRKAYRNILADTEGFIRKIAADQLVLARDWAEQGDLNIILDENTFASLLKIDDFSIVADRLTVWLLEDADIFAGHAIEVRIEGGEVIEICLAG
eukprot:gene28176-36361_t